MSGLPGLGIVRGMAFTLRRFFQPAGTVRYPEVTPEISPRTRGRLQLLHDEHGTLKCETCFQCAQACPIECIEMGGVDTRRRYGVYWGAAETYAERREESALRRSGCEVPDNPATRWEPVDLGPVRQILDRHDYDPHAMLSILEATQAAYGNLPVAALREISSTTGAWYAMVYGTASSYRHFHFEQPARAVAVCRCPACLAAGGGRLAEALGAGLGTELGRVAPSGIRLEWLAAHPGDAGSPAVVLDDELQPEVSPGNARAWARALAGTHPASRTVH
jgi:NADH:ubiquinone oxidoreductase subunit E